MSVRFEMSLCASSRTFVIFRALTVNSGWYELSLHPYSSTHHNGISINKRLFRALAYYP
jgi:hypothetical protein